VIQRPITSTTIVDVEIEIEATEPGPGDAGAGALARGTGALDATAVTARTTPPGPPGLRARPRGTPNELPAGSSALRALIFAPERTRAGWIEGELSRAPVTIQVARRVRTVVAALIKDPPPRPEILIVDFDAVSPAELIELHAIRDAGWLGRLIGLGRVPADLRGSLAVEAVLPVPLVRDSLLDCVAGTRHATETVPIPVGLFVALGLSGRSEK
jgi:hypothetical protein